MRLGQGELQRQVLGAVRAGPLPMATVAMRLNRDVNTVRGSMNQMLKRGMIECHGTASALGIDAPFGQTKCYGLPRGDVFDAELEDDDVPQRAPAARPSESSGELTPAPYATGFRWWNVSW